MAPEQFKVKQLGERRVPSPLKRDDGGVRFISDGARIPLQPELRDGEQPDTSLAFEKAGPREYIYFDPKDVRAALVTCGGICPGLNNVIRSIVMQLWFGYGVRNILGIRHGYAGMHLDRGLHPLLLSPEVVSRIHREGGTLLGTSRGPGNMPEMLDFLRHHGINVLFTIGGDGTQRGAHALMEEACRQGYELALVGVPKTIDNDISYVWRTFGFATAMEIAAQIIDCAHTEARGHINGVGLVKLMGREAGFIAAAATVANQDVNFTLIPEVPFELEGERGFLKALERRLDDRGHAVVVVAEGAGQDLIGKREVERDASGNIKLADIGPFLKERIKDYFRTVGKIVDVKYFDPSYAIRSAPANAADSIYCDELARHAVHAAMAGKTGIIIGSWYNVATHVPIPLLVGQRRRLTESSDLWQSVLKMTGQPARFINT